MKFTVNNNKASANGASLKGWVITTFEGLCERLGPPKGGSSDGKTTAEWILEGSDGTIALIYDWKTTSTPKDFYEWHIGGHTSKALDLVSEALQLDTKKFRI